MTKEAQGVYAGKDYLSYVRALKGTFPQVDPALVMAIMETESSFDPNAYKGEPQINDASRGLMQLLFSTAQWLGFTGTVDKLCDPQTNIYFGMKFLQWLYGRCDGNLECIIMSYNEGNGNYRKGKRVWTYYTKVLARLEKWRALI